MSQKHSLCFLTNGEHPEAAVILILILILHSLFFLLILLPPHHYSHFCCRAPLSSPVSSPAPLSPNTAELCRSCLFNGKILHSYQSELESQCKYIYTYKHKKHRNSSGVSTAILFSNQQALFHWVICFYLFFTVGKFYGLPPCLGSTGCSSPCPDSLRVSSHGSPPSPNSSSSAKLLKDLPSADQCLQLL